MEGKTLSEQLPQYEAIVTEYERIRGHTYADDAKVASILQKCPSYMKQRLQLWVDDLLEVKDHAAGVACNQVGLKQQSFPSHSIKRG